MTGDDRRMTEVSRASSLLAFVAFSAANRFPSRIKSGTGFRRKTLLAPPVRPRSSARAPNSDFLMREILFSCAAQQQETVHEAARFRTKCGRCARIASGLLTQLCARRGLPPGERSLLRCGVLAAALDAEFGARNG